MIPTELQLKKDGAGKRSSGIIGEVRYHRDLLSPRLSRSRDVIVWLPPSYRKDPQRRFPVLYMQDGQNLMDPNTAFLGYDWRTDEVTTRLLRARKLREIIIVGIYNTPDRQQEYSGSKAGRDYADFVVHELKPFLDAKYRTLPGRANTGAMGSSMGGLISFFFAWWYPEVFAQVACVSSSFFWDRQRVIKEVLTYSGPKKKFRIYLDVGGKEPFLIPGYCAMISVLKGQGYIKGDDLEYYFARDAEHNEREWSKRLWRPLTFLFSNHGRSDSSSR